MLNSSASVWLGVTFVIIGAINVCLVLQASARVRDAKASALLITAHRIGGYLFIALFCTMGYFMVARLGDVAAGSSSTTMIHMTLAMVLSPLIFVKVLIARYYKTYHGLLMPIGLVIFVLSFVLIGVTVGPTLAHKTRMETVSLASIDMPPARIDMSLAAATMEKRCSRCHTLDRIAGARKDAAGWLSTVNRMRALPDSGVSEDDSRIIVSYLASRMVPKGSAEAAGMEVARALVDQRCSRCHSLDRVYRAAETTQEWSATVKRMLAFAQGSSNAFHPGEDQKIIAYLSATQTPEAVGKRSAPVAESSTDQTPAIQGAGAPIAQAAGLHHYDGTLIAFLSIVCSGTLALIVRRPARSVPAGANSNKAVAERLAGAARATSPPPQPILLRLVSLIQQTPDAKTLRFAVSDNGPLQARPGQFLTFSFLFDGKKITRSYSICSSSLRSGYIEITPKRVPNGCASVFLNDRAAPGMTVEAKGPFGNFYFEETRHDNIVLLAAGSGITPMMAMVRYIEDLSLETRVTLLYCVRTGKDIMFEAELETLRTSLKNFRYHVLLSQPHDGWSGPRGHINREFIENTVRNPATPDFFLCGPPPFMEACRDILTNLGVKPQRIMQESFGGSVPNNSRPELLSNQPGGALEFVRSGKSCTIRRGQTLLEAAEENGVAIPSSCRQGQCGTCKTRLIAGKVTMDAEEGLDPDSKEHGFVLTCVGRANGDIRLDARPSGFWGHTSRPDPLTR